MLHDLRKITYLHIVRNSNFSVCRILDAADKLENSRLSCTILSDKTYLIVLADMEINIVKEDETSISDSKTIY